MKNKSWKLIVTKQEYSIDISEEYEYSHEKAERASLPHNNTRIQFIQNTTKQKQNTQTLQVKYLRCDRIKI